MIGCHCFGHNERLDKLQSLRCLEVPAVDAVEIRVENLRETLRLLQRCIAISVTASLALVLLEFAPPPSDLQKGALQIPGVFVAITPPFAVAILVAAHIAAGLMAYAAALHIRHIAFTIGDLDCRSAALTFPTIVTIKDPLARTIAVLLAPALFLAYRVRSAFVAWPFDDSEEMIHLIIVLFGVMPYVGVLRELRILLRQTDTGKET
jgi:hypothetical protein